MHLLQLLAALVAVPRGVIADVQSDTMQQLRAAIDPGNVLTGWSSETAVCISGTANWVPGIVCSGTDVVML